MTLSEASTLINNEHLKSQTPQIWADLGCGDGLFSRALLSLLPAQSSIYAIDQHPFSFTEPNIHFLKLDFVHQPLELPQLDGILMANSLHFVPNKLLLLEKIKTQLRPNGIFVLVEYDTEVANPWVLYPLSFAAATKLFAQSGFAALGKSNERQSLYQRAKIYAALFKFISS